MLICFVKSFLSDFLLVNITSSNWPMIIVRPFIQNWRGNLVFKVLYALHIYWYNKYTLYNVHTFLELFIPNKESKKEIGAGCISPLTFVCHHWMVLEKRLVIVRYLTRLRGSERGRDTMGNSVCHETMIIKGWKRIWRMGREAFAGRLYVCTTVQEEFRVFSFIRSLIPKSFGFLLLLSLPLSLYFFLSLLIWELVCNIIML